MDANILIIVVTVLAALSVGGLSYAFIAPAMDGRSRANKRLKAITRGDSVGPAKKGVADKTKDRRKAITETLKELEEKQRERNKSISMRERIERAGLTVSVQTFWVLSAVCGVAAVLFAITWGLNLMMSVAMGFIAGLGLPRWILGFLAARRPTTFFREFPNAVYIIVCGVKAGLPLNECLHIIANEAEDPVGEQFREIVDSLRMGMPMEEALTRLYDQMPIPEVNFFVIVISIQSKAGGNLSEALNNLSNVLRGRRMLQEKIKAMSSEARASASIIGSLPPLVMILVYLTTPDYIMLLFTERLGNAFLIGGGLWMLTGIFIMKKMISFKH